MTAGSAHLTGGTWPGDTFTAPADVFTGLAHSVPHLVRIGMTELFQNCQCTLPGELGRVCITKGLVDVTERGEAVRLVVTVAALTVQINCLLIANYALAPCRPRWRCT